MSRFNLHSSPIPDIEIGTEQTPLLNNSPPRRDSENTSNSDVTTVPVSSQLDHQEHHSSYGDYIKHAVIGFADGLTVPFALTAGVSATGDRRFVILSGVAELLSGMISMGLGAWLGSALDTKKYEVEREREQKEVEEVPEREEQEIREIMAKYRVKAEVVEALIEGFKKDHDAWVDFMMDYEVKEEKPHPQTAVICAFVMGLSYLLGGLIPLMPYFCTSDLQVGLYASIGVTMVTLLVFGYARAIAEGVGGAAAIKNATWTFIVGMAAAGTSYGIVLGINEHLSANV